MKVVLPKAIKTYDQLEAYLKRLREQFIKREYDRCFPRAKEDKDVY